MAIPGLPKGLGKVDLIENMKQLLPELARKVVNKKPQTKKRWWTKDEVFLLC